jgi:hypothetical protein
VGAASQDVNSKRGAVQRADKADGVQEPHRSSDEVCHHDAFATRVGGGLPQRETEKGALTSRARDTNIKVAEPELDFHRNRLGEDRLALNRRERRSIGKSTSSQRGGRGSTMGLTLGHKGRRHTQDLHDIGVVSAASKINQVLLVTGGESIRNRLQVRPRGVARARSQVFKVNNGDFTDGTQAAMVFEGKVERYIRDSLGLDSNKHRLKVDAREADRVNGVRVGVRPGRMSDVVALPVLERVAADGESRHRLVLKDEPLPGLVVSLEEHRGFTTNERAIVDGILPVSRGGENRDPSTQAGGEQRDTIRATAQVSRLVDEGILIGLVEVGVGVEEGIGDSVKMPKVDEGHIDIDMIGPNRLLQVLSITQIIGVRIGLGGSRRLQVDISVQDREEQAILTVSSWLDRDEVGGICGSSTAITLEHELLRVLFFFLRISSMTYSTNSTSAGSRQGIGVNAGTSLKHQLLRVLFNFGNSVFLRCKSHSSRHHQAARGALVIGVEAEGARKAGSRAGTRRIISGRIHEGSSTSRKGGLRRRKGREIGGGRGRRGGEGEGRQLTGAFTVAGAAATAAAHRVSAVGDKVTGGEALVAPTGGEAERGRCGLGAGSSRLTR